MEKPTAAQVREVLPTVEWAAAPDAPDPDPIEFQVGMAADYVEEVTGREFATMPERYERMALMAVALLAALTLTDVSAETLEALSGAGTLQSFSADGYSETYRAPGDVDKAQATARMIHPNPLLNRLLWLIATPEKRAEWLAFWSGGTEGGIPMWGISGVCWPHQHDEAELPGFADPFRSWTPGEL